VEKLGTVLVVDGDADSRTYITGILAARGFLVESYARGGDALDRMTTSINGQTVGIVIADLTLPDMGGQALTRRIGESYKHVISVYVTSLVPAPVVAGSRVFSKLLPNPDQFCDFVWSLLKTSVFVASVAELKAGIVAQAEASARCRANVDERFGSLRIPGLAAAVGADWQQAPKSVRWGITALLSVVGSLLTAGCVLGWWILSDVRTRGAAIAPLEMQVKLEIVPAIREVRMRQDEINIKQVELREGQMRVAASVAEILRRTPPTPSPQTVLIPPRGTP